MAQPDDFFIQMPFGNNILDTYGREILDTAGRNILDLDWANVNSDVLTETPITIFQGQRDGSDPRARVADAGFIKFELDNSINNSGGLLGYYSPDNSNLRDPDFNLGMLVRVGMEKDSVTEWLAQGRITSIEPDPGLLGDKRVLVTAGDWMELAANTVMPRIEVQESVTDDQALQTIIDALGTDAPASTDLDVGDYTYEYAFTDVEDERTYVMSVLQSLGQSGQGRIFITGGTTSGEVLKYVNLTNLLSIGTPVATFVDDFTAAKASRKVRTRVRRVLATAYPHAKDSAPVVLFNLTEELSIPAGETAEFVGYFRDPNDSSAKKIAAINVVQPVAATDFNFSSVSGSGSDLNASLGFEVWSVGTKSFRVRLINNSGSTGYLWFYQVRGEGLYPYDELGYSATDTTINERDGITLDYDLPYQSTQPILAEIASALLGWYSVESTQLPYIDFVPSLSDDDFEKMLVSKPGELIAVTDTVTGISYNMLVVGRELQIWNNGKYIEARLYITPTLQVESGLYATLETLGLDDLDGTNTILGFGS